MNDKIAEEIHNELINIRNAIEALTDTLRNK